MGQKLRSDQTDITAFVTLSCLKITRLNSTRGTPSDGGRGVNTRGKAEGRKSLESEIREQDAAERCLPEPFLRRGSDGEMVSSSHKWKTGWIHGHKTAAVCIYALNSRPSGRNGPFWEEMLIAKIVSETNRSRYAGSHVRTSLTTRAQDNMRSLPGRRVEGQRGAVSS